MISKPKILIVDDSLTEIAILKMILAKCDWIVIDAMSGEKAMEIARREKPNLILLDIVMPDMDGFETCQKLMSDPDLKNTAVIFLSASASVEDKVRGLALGAVDFVSKPFDKTEIIARVSTHLSLQHTKSLLWESEKRYSALVDNLLDGVFLWTPAANITFANKSLSSMLETPVEEFAGKKLCDIFDQEYASELEGELSDIFLAGDAGGKSETSVKITRRNGSVIHAVCSASFICHNKNPGVMVTVRDMTERINLEKQLSHAGKLEAIGSLTSGIAHDFNNILSLINGYAELLMLEIPEDSPLKGKLEIILNAGRNAVSLTKGLLSFSKSKSTDFEAVDISEELEKTFAFLERSLPKNISLNLDLNNAVAPALADPGLFQQIFVNLCLNSRDAMPHGGKITVRLEKTEVKNIPPFAPHDAAPGKYVKILLRDSGPGIPAHIKDRIFDPFFTTKNNKGAGLGLAMVERIIKNHKGWIELDSAQEQGAGFALFLPLLDETAPLTKTAKYVHNYTPSLNKILVVDDDEIQISLIRHFLEKYNYVVAEANSAEAAISMIEKNPEDYGLAIIDHVMPQTTGAECAKVIRSRWPKIRIIMMSGAVAVPLAGDDFLKKPFTIKDLLSSLENLQSLQ